MSAMSLWSLFVFGGLALYLVIVFYVVVKSYPGKGRKMRNNGTPHVSGDANGKRRTRSDGDKQHDFSGDSDTKNHDDDEINAGGALNSLDSSYLEERREEKYGEHLREDGGGLRSHS